MKWRRLALLPLLCATAQQAHAAAQLEPYQMVRSLQIVQDRIAGGDHAALPMQLKLLGMIDARLKTATVEDFADARNLRATLIYGMSGGNPATVAAVLQRIEPQEEDRQLARGISFYLRGETGSAMAVLEGVEPVKLAPEIGAFVALVKGSIIAQDDPKTAAALFDWARLLGPGTLVEEAALRRSLATNAEAGDVERFLTATSLYVRRFLHSPYATQFADGLVKGIVKLNTALDFATIEAMIAEMTPEHQKVIYLRLARTAAIEGLRELSDFASLKAEGFDKGTGGAQDARAALYANLSSVASEGAEQTLAKLAAIDPRLLSPADRQLLDAALSVARNVVAPAEAPAAAEPRRVSVEEPSPAQEAALPVQDTPSPQSADAQAETGKGEPQGEQAKPAVEGEPTSVARNLAPSPGAAQDPDATAIGQASEVAAAAKAKLDEIDKLLEQTQ